MDSCGLGYLKKGYVKKGYVKKVCLEGQPLQVGSGAAHGFMCWSEK